MLRYCIVASIAAFCAQDLSAQGLLDYSANLRVATTEVRTELRVGYWLPEWSELFADSLVRKSQLAPKPSLLSGKPAGLPSGMRPTEYIGRDGLPGDPLPAVHHVDEPRSAKILWEKLKEFRLDADLEKRVKESVTTIKK
jgi:hypothetical protein